MHQLNFKNKTILITGATRGIGKQMAEDLYQLEANLLLTGTNEDEIKILNDLAVKKNERKTFFCADFSNSKSTNQFFNKIESFPKIDGLVNNAGINRLNSIEKIQKKDFDDMLSVNLSTPVLLINQVSKKMIKNGYGKILNVASIFSKISKEKRSLYSTTKFGLHGLTVGASNDLARYNVLVNSISPGFIMTDLTKKNFSQKDMDFLTSQIPAKRMGTVQDISSVAIFLLSDLNKYITGQNIVVDGGFTNV